MTEATSDLEAMVLAVTGEFLRQVRVRDPIVMEEIEAQKERFDRFMLAIIFQQDVAEFIPEPEGEADEPIHVVHSENDAS